MMLDLAGSRRRDSWPSVHVVTNRRRQRGKDRRLRHKKSLARSGMVRLGRVRSGMVRLGMVRLGGGK